MSQITSLLTLQAQLALLMAVGIFLRKTGLIDQNAKKFLTDLIIHVVLPFNIVQSFRMDFSWEIMQRTFSVFVISLIIQICCGVIARFGVNGFSYEKKAILQYGIIVSNAGFLGNPLAEGIFGAEGLLLASIYLIPQRIVMWSIGVSYFAGEAVEKTPEAQKQHRREVLRKSVTHPCIVAVLIGVFILVLQPPLPSFLGNTIKSIGGCNTALSMILIGAIMAEGDFSGMLNKDILAYCLIRLALIPGAVLLGCKLCNVNTFVTGVSVILAAMPMGITTPILAEKYKCDAQYAAKCLAVSTILSLMTTPLWCLIV